MMSRLLAGRVQTVLGTIDPAQMGITLPHEHLFVDTTALLEPPAEATDRARSQMPFTLENLGWIRYNYFRHHENVRLDDEETAIAEAELFRRAGGTTIVDVTPIGLGRDPLALARVARATGVNVVMATGYYVGATHPPSLAAASEEELVTRMVTEIRAGAILERATPSGHDIVRPDVHTNVRAGVVKVGCSYPLLPAEEKVLRAAVETQRQTGAAITIHVGRHDESALQIVGVLEDAGADMSHTILGHLELRIERLETLDRVAASGCCLELDLFGHEQSYFPNAERDMPSDAQRLDLLEHLREIGALDRVLVSHDVCSKHRLARYGGHGYSYLPACVAPRMRERGFTEAEVEAMLVSNPARALAFGRVSGARAAGARVD
jgi:phosphotriesterase-related protein